MKGFFLFCALLLTVSYARYSGINIALLQKTIGGLKGAFYVYLKNQLLTQPIQDITIAGYTLTNIRVLEFNQFNEDFEMELGDGVINFDADNFGFKADMIASKPKTFKEPLEVLGNDCEILFTVTPNFDPATGLMTYTVSDVEVTLDGLQASAKSSVIEGTANNLLEDEDFVDNIQNMLAANLQTGLTKNLNQMASSFPNQVPIPGAPLALATNMIAAPYIESDYMTLFFDGTVFTPSAGLKIPPIPEPILLPTVHPSDERGAQMFIADYVFNSALYETWTHNGIEFIMTDDLLPAGSSLRLTTDSMNSIFPGLLDKYGTGKFMAIDCLDLGGAPPVMQSANGMLQGTVSGFCDLYVIEERWKRALTISGTMVSNGKINIVGSQPFYTIETINFSNLDIPETTLPPLDSNMVQNNLNNGVASWLPYSKPMPLVLLPQNELANPEVRHHDGYTEILFDLIFPEFTGNFDMQSYLGKLGGF
jgi:hypothetical protein